MRNLTLYSNDNRIVEAGLSEASNDHPHPLVGTKYKFPQREGTIQGIITEVFNDFAWIQVGGPTAHPANRGDMHPWSHWYRFYDGKAPIIELWFENKPSEYIHPE